MVPAVNFIVVVTHFLASLVLDVHRIKQRQAEPVCFFCHPRALAKMERDGDNAVSKCMSLEERFNFFLKKFAPFIVKFHVMIWCDDALRICKLGPWDRLFGRCWKHSSQN